MPRKKTKKKDTKDITLDDLDEVLITLDAYDKLLDHAKKNWLIMTNTERQRAIEAFEHVAEISKEFAD
jgi:hypothetical protein